MLDLGQRWPGLVLLDPILFQLFHELVSERKLFAVNNKNKEFSLNKDMREQIAPTFTKVFLF